MQPIKMLSVVQLYNVMRICGPKSIQPPEVGKCGFMATVSFRFGEVGRSMGFWSEMA
jgi:hypothetical protein